MKRILVTGASGFVGGLLVQRLLDAGFALNLPGRMVKPQAREGQIRHFAVGEVGSQTDWRPALDDCEAVVHLAAQLPNPGVSEEAFSEVNDRGTGRLIEQAAASDARLFILMSSLYAIGDSSSDAPVSERTPPDPSTVYGRSKLAAERHMTLFAGAGRSGIVLRPPIVYGPGAQGNWRSLQRLAATGVPLPFGMVNNRRTLVAAENLVDAVFNLVSSPGARSNPGVYMVADDQAVSLREMLAWLRSGMGMSPRLVPLPPALLRFSLGMIGKEKVAKSLLGNLEVNSNLFRKTFGWAPKVNPRDGMTRSGAGFQR